MWPTSYTRIQFQRLYTKTLNWYNVLNSPALYTIPSQKNINTCLTKLYTNPMFVYANIVYNFNVCIHEHCIQSCQKKTLHFGTRFAGKHKPCQKLKTCENQFPCQLSQNDQLAWNLFVADWHKSCSLAQTMPKAKKQVSCQQSQIDQLALKMLASIMKWINIQWLNEYSKSWINIQPLNEYAIQHKPCQVLLVWKMLMLTCQYHTKLIINTCLDHFHFFAFCALDRLSKGASLYVGTESRLWGVYSHRWRTNLRTRGDRREWRSGGERNEASLKLNASGLPRNPLL